MSQPAEQRAGKPAMLKDKDFQWEDPLDLEGELTEEERMVRDTARGFAQDYLMPRVSRPIATRPTMRTCCPRWASSACSARPSLKNTAAPAWAMSATG